MPEIRSSPQLNSNSSNSNNYYCIYMIVQITNDRICKMAILKKQCHSKKQYAGWYFNLATPT